MTQGLDVHVRGYLVVFGALLVLTLATVAASSLDLAAGPTIALGLAIATVKAALVGAFFMHLLHERAIVYGTLGLTAVLAAALFAFTAWTEADHPPGVRMTSPFTVQAAPAPDGGH